MRSKASILIVEDHVDSRALLARVLKLHGYDATSAASARDARLLAAYTDFDLALCDLNLADECGAELYADLRRKHALRGICVTGSSKSEALPRIEQAGFDAYLMKPLTPSQLIETIEEVLQRFRPRQRNDDVIGRESIDAP